jgi:PAS domain S-box-containing protein
MTKQPPSEPERVVEDERVPLAVAAERAPRPVSDRFVADPETMRALLAAIVESSDDAVIAKDLNGTILAWNAAAERIFGYRSEEVVGLPITILLPKERLPEEVRVLATLRSGRRIDHYETERVRKDGTLLRISLSVSPIRDATGTIVGAAKIARDVTTQYRLQRERDASLEREQAARIAAETANRAKDAFLATISHELRTPLSPILMWTRMLRDGLLDGAKSDRALEAIERNARAQAQLIDDLLDVSRIVSGKLKLEIRPTDLVAVIHAAMDVVRPAADAKGIQLQFAVDGRPDTIAGDPDRLQQVAWNLLSNAIKFTPEGGRVDVTLVHTDPHVQIAVRDTGEGFAPAFRSSMFERFQQADGSASRRHGGLGLGLAIVRHIVELHGGAVDAESAGPGQGACFTVRLPIGVVQRQTSAVESERSRSQAAADAGTVAAHAVLHGVRVLVVDDEPDSNEAVSTLLGAAAAEVRGAASAAQALEILARWTPHVIVTDIAMPGEDGYVLLAKIRADESRLARIPAIAVTAYATRRDRLRILAAGFQMHIAKPIDPAEFIAAVVNVVATARRDRS